MTAENVVSLRPKERVRQNAEPVATIYRNLGPSSAEQVVTRALGELALAMAGLAQQVQRHELAGLERQLRRLQHLADHLGLISLGLVAADVRVCLGSGDVTAFAAVWARLLRVAERSLAIQKDMVDQTQT